MSITLYFGLKTPWVESSYLSLEPSQLKDERRYRGDIAATRSKFPLSFYLFLTFYFTFYFFSFFLDRPIVYLGHLHEAEYINVEILKGADDMSKVGNTLRAHCPKYITHSPMTKSISKR